MPFASFFNTLKEKASGGQCVSTPHVAGQVGNVGAQMMSAGLEGISPNSTIFTKMVQFIADLQAVLHPSTNFSERIEHMIQGLIVAAALVIQIVIYFEGCKHSDEGLCMVLPLLEIAYAAFLTATAGSTTYFGIRGMMAKKTTEPTDIEASPGGFTV